MTEHINRNGNYGIPVDGMPPLRQEVAEGEVSLNDLLEIILKGKWLIAGAFFLVLAIAAALTLLRASEYDTSSMVYVNSQQNTPQLNEMLGLQVDNRNIANEVEILKSRAIAHAVAKRLLAESIIPGSGEKLTVLETAEEGHDLTDTEVAQRLRSRYVNVRPVSRDVDMIEIVGTSTVPEEAAHIANLYAEEYVDYNRNLSRARMRASREFLSDVTERFQTDLEAAEEDLTAFLNSEKVVAPEEEAKQLIEQVTQLQQLQYQTQYELGMAQAELKAIEQEVAQIMPELAAKITSGDDIMIDRLIQEIAELNLQIEQKYARNPGLRDDHSKDQELRRRIAEVAALEKELQQRAERMVHTAAQSGGLAIGSPGGSSSSRDRLTTLQDLRRRMMEKQVYMSGLQARLDVLNDQLNASKTVLGRIPGQEIILNRLERSLMTREQLYVTLVEKLQEARIAEQSELGYVDIIDEAIVPDAPVRPRTKLNLIFGAFLGLLLGVGLAFVRNAVDNKVRTPESLRKAGISVLSVIPAMDLMVNEDFGGEDFYPYEGHQYSTSLITLLNPLSPLAEGYRRLASNLNFSRPDNPIRSVVVTSPTMGDGKTSTALNLAIVFAQMGRRTVYVDADLRRAAGHVRMDVPREPGIVDLLFREKGDSVSRFATIVDGLYLIPAGRKVPNPSEILESRKLRDLLSQLQGEFEVVIIDSPPVLAVADVLSLSSRSDATVLVCSAGRTTWPLLERSLQDLSAVKSKFSGIVLNRFDPKSAYGSYAYRYGYGYRYEDETSEAYST